MSSNTICDKELAALLKRAAAALEDPHAPEDRGDLISSLDHSATLLDARRNRPINRLRRTAETPDKEPFLTRFAIAMFWTFIANPAVWIFVISAYHTAPPGPLPRYFTSRELAFAACRMARRWRRRRDHRQERFRMAALRNPDISIAEATRQAASKLPRAPRVCAMACRTACSGTAFPARSRGAVTVEHRAAA